MRPGLTPTKRRMRLGGIESRRRFGGFLGSVRGERRLRLREEGVGVMLVPLVARDRDVDGGGDGEDNGVVGVVGVVVSRVENVVDVGVEEDDGESDCAAAAVTDRVNGLRPARSEVAACFVGLVCLNRDNRSRKARVLSVVMLGTSSSPAMGAPSNSSWSFRFSASSLLESDCRISGSAMMSGRSGVCLSVYLNSAALVAQLLAWYLHSIET